MELCEVIQYFKCEREMCADCKLNCNALFGLECMLSYVVFLSYCQASEILIN